MVSTQIVSAEARAQIVRAEAHAEAEVCLALHDVLVVCEGELSSRCMRLTSCDPSFAVATSPSVMTDMFKDQKLPRSFLCAAAICSHG